MEINEQVVVVTGASRGLGAEIARSFAREGAYIAVNYVKNRNQADHLVAEIGTEQAMAIQADVRSETEVAAMFMNVKEYFGKPVTTIVNNALIGFRFDGDQRKKLDEMAWSDFQTQFEGGVQAAFHTLRAAREDMVKQQFGRIINIGTNLVQDPVVPYQDYNTGKAALLGLTRNMAKELGPSGITVNMISAGLLHKTDASASTPDDVFAGIKEATPLQRVTSPPEVADASLFFASPWSRAITGQNIMVDGGLVMN